MIPSFGEEPNKVKINIFCITDEKSELRLRMFILDLIFSIPDPESTSKNFSILTQKNVSACSRKYDLDSSSRNRILNFYPSRIQGSKRPLLLGSMDGMRPESVTTLHTRESRNPGCRNWPDRRCPSPSSWGRLRRPACCSAVSAPPAHPPSPAGWSSSLG